MNYFPSIILTYYSLPHLQFRFKMKLIIKLLFAIIYTVSFITAMPVMALDGWKSDTNNGCRFWDTEIISDQSMRWSGACQNGLVDGYGVITWKRPGEPEWTWQGYFKAGHSQRLYIIYGLDNEIESYEGDYVDGKRHGYGRIKGRNGLIYTGEFKNGIIEGQGVMTLKNGYKYEGDFKDGKAYGNGTIYYLDGSIYTGGVKNSLRDGYGTYRGIISYSGDWSDDKYHGQGVQESGGVTTYGNFVRGKWDGDMVIRYPNGQTMLSC